jgi:hypothetical protein
MSSLRHLPGLRLAVGWRTLAGAAARLSRTHAALTLLTSALFLWLQPPPVLPLPSRSGPDGPPRPYGALPPPGREPPHTGAAQVRAQDRALLYGPFPRGGLERGVSDGTLLLAESAAARAAAVAKISAAGATVARIPVDWRDVVAAQPAAGFDAADPASPGYRFARIDAAVRSAASGGLQVLLVVSHAPAFAEAPHRWPYAYLGSWAPSPTALREFATALARRYDGAFPDPLEPGRALPRVQLLQAWNEPNLARYLEPQWVARGGRWSAFSPLLYRQLLNAFYAGVKSVAPGDTVVAAGVAPEGEPEGVGDMAPVTFLRSLLCLDGGGQDLLPVFARVAGRSGRVFRPAGRAVCPERPHFDVLAFHPLSVYNPDTPALSSLDASISDIGKITGLLRRAERLHTILPAGAKPLWVTELNWQSAPQSPTGVPPRLQAAWISRALHRLWVAGVQLVDWQFLIDPYPELLLSDPTGATLELSRPAGLYLPGPGGNPALATPKPFLYGFAFPFDPLRVDRRHVRVWALLTGPGQAVQLQRQMRDSGWRTLVRLRADGYGVLNALVSLAGPARLRLGAGSRVSATVVVAGD